MAVMKSLMKRDWFHGAICWTVAQYLRFVFVTGRWELRNADILYDAQRSGALMPVMWHNRIAMAAFAWDTKIAPLTALASGHRDGLVVTRTLSHFGVRGVSIPPKQSGMGAARQVVKILKAGESVVITPDGPRGPRQHLKEGVITIAKLAKVPLILVTCNASRRKLFNSWDKFILPLPFSKGVVAFRRPPIFTEDMDSKTYRVLLEQSLQKLTDEIDQEMGFQPIEPATPEEVEKAIRKGAKI